MGITRDAPPSGGGKKEAPAGVRGALRRLHYRIVRPLPHQLSYLAQCALHRRRPGFGRSTLAVADVRNALPNSGPIPYEREGVSAAQLVDEMGSRRGGRRRQDLEGFEGFAPDDAVYDEPNEHWRIWSYSAVATVIARCAYEVCQTPSVLELGCGGGHVFQFLRGLGITDYIGLDGHPYFMELNRVCRANAAHFRTLNLQQEIGLQLAGRPVSFDVVCSFEVLEHIREDAVDNFIRSMWSHMHGRSVALVTASQVPQELCDVHVLVRPRTWWLDRFQRHGLLPHASAAAIEKDLAAHHPHNWSAKNSEIFALRRAG